MNLRKTILTIFCALVVVGVGASALAPTAMADVLMQSVRRIGATFVVANVGHATLDVDQRGAGSILNLSDSGTDEYTFDLSSATFVNQLNLSDDLAIGNGTPTVTLNGEDAYVEGTLEVDGAARLDGALTMTGLFLPTSSAITATTGALVSTGFFQPLTASGTVTPTITPGTAGTTTCFYMTSAQSAVFVDSGNVVLAGNLTMGQYDVLCGRSDGTRWIEFSRTNN